MWAGVSPNVSNASPIVGSIASVISSATCPGNDIPICCVAKKLLSKVWPFLIIPLPNVNTVLLFSYKHWCLETF